MLISDIQTIEDKYLFLEKDENGRDIFIYKLINCQFSGDNLLYPNILVHSNDKLYSPIKERILSLNIEDKKEYDFINNSCLSTENNPVFFFVYNTDNYYHFVYDTLPYLISFIELRKSISGLKLLMNYPNVQQKSFYNFVTEFLELLDIKSNDIILVNADTIYENVYVSTSYTHDFDSNLPPRKEIYELYKTIVDKVDLDIDTPKKIYVSRRSWIHGDYSNIGTNYTLRRKLVNEDELVDILNKNGFVEVFTERLSTIEKIKYFNNAEIVIGAIGGGICNVLFSQPQTKLIALISPTFLDVNSRFIYSLNCVNLNLFKNTSHFEESKFKTNMRVLTIDGIVGEIEKIENDNVTIIYSEEKISGWNSQMVYKRVNVKINELTTLDDGLNSPWLVDLEKIKIINE